MIGWWILFIILVIIAVGLLPSWPYSREWGYYPAGILWLLIMALFFLIVTGVFERS